MILVGKWIVTQRPTAATETAVFLKYTFIESRYCAHSDTGLIGVQLSSSN